MPVREWAHPPVPRGWYVDPENDADLRLWESAGIPMLFYTAIMGRYDYYLVHRYDNQGW